MSREQLLALVNTIPEKDIERIYNTILSHIKEEKALADEVEAIKEARKDNSPLIPHDDFWKDLI